MVFFMWQEIYWAAWNADGCKPRNFQTGPMDAKLKLMAPEILIPTEIEDANHDDELVLADLSVSYHSDSNSD